MIIALYVVSIFTVLRSLFLCATTEPGIIPPVRSDIVNYDRPYSAVYRDPNDELVRQQN